MFTSPNEATRWLELMLSYFTSAHWTKWVSFQLSITKKYNFCPIVLINLDYALENVFDYFSITIDLFISFILFKRLYFWFNPSSFLLFNMYNIVVTAFFISIYILYKAIKSHDLLVIGLKKQPELCLDMAMLILWDNCLLSITSSTHCKMIKNYSLL